MSSPSIQIYTHSFHFVDHRQTGTENYRSCCNNLHISYHHNCYIRRCSSCIRWNTVDRTFPHNMSRTCQSDIFQYIAPIFSDNLPYMYCIVSDTCHHRFPSYIHKCSIHCCYRHYRYNLYCMRKNNLVRNVWSRNRHTGLLSNSIYSYHSAHHLENRSDRYNLEGNSNYRCLPSTLIDTL